MRVKIFHNPRCSKSRQTLAILQERGIDPEIVRYLDEPPDAETLRDLLSRLGLTAAQLIRRGEKEYRELGLDAAGVDENDLVRAMVEHPRLIQRPIVVAGGKARLGRPPEAVLEIL
ncbi:MAG: arsenate reductase (glutaredoxin) [Gammaproteobacteria bacterium]